MFRQLFEQQPDPLVPIFLEDGPLVDEIRALGAQPAVVRAGRVREIGRYVATVGRIARIVGDRRPDLVVGWGSKGQAYGGPAALATRTPSAWYQVGYSDGTPMSRAASIWPAKGVFVVSNRAARAHAKRWPQQRTVVVHPGADLTRFDAGALPGLPQVRRKLGLPSEVPIFGIVARLQQWKGVHDVIEALPRVKAVAPDARCIVVGGEHSGEPGYAARLAADAKRLGVGDSVVFAGHQTNIPEWMQAMDVVVHASRFEPFGIVVVEAMALGKPVVAGAQDGPTEIITPGVDGQLFEPGNPSALAEAILRYLQEPAFAAEIGRRARRRAEAFSANRYVDEFMTALASLVRSG
jgi:glycosyltransferase involved in cell wall biosynthesis